MISESDLAQEHDHDGEILRYVDSIPTHDDPDFNGTDHQPVASTRFNVANEHAVPVYERGTSSFVAISQAIGSSTLMILGRHRGRKYVVLSAPVTITVAGTATTPNGFQWSHDRGMVDAGAGFQLNPGDAAQVDSEAEIFVGPLPGNTTGYVQILELFSTLGGPAGN